MKYFTKQWRDDTAEQGKMMFEGINQRPWSEQLQAFDDYIQQVASDYQNYYGQNEQLQSLDNRIKQVLTEYWNHYEQILPNLTEGVKNITYNNLHDAVIIGTQFIGKDFCIKLDPRFAKLHRNQLSSVDLTGIKSTDPDDIEDEYFYVSELIFINAKVLKDELCCQGGIYASWLYDEIYIQPGGYELRVLANVWGDSRKKSKQGELIITFDDVIIKVLDGDS